MTNHAVLTTEAPTPLAVNRTPQWYAGRQNGMTATEIRDWNIPSKRRKIIAEKVTGESDMRDNRHFQHGRAREPHIAEWAALAWGVVPENRLHAHPRNPRHLATPDGHLGGFVSEGYTPGPDAVTVEVKTSSKDLTPGPIDAKTNTLLRVDPASHFAKSLYMRQVQWQMYVMNAGKCLFIWEPFEHRVDPETSLFIVTGPPQAVFIERDQALIDQLVAEADEALRTIDAARHANFGGLPPVSDVPTDEAILLMDLFAAREAVATAEAARDKAWAALTALYDEQSGGKDFSEDKGIAQVTRSTPAGKPGRKFDRALAEKRAPKALAQHDAFIERYTVETPAVPGKPKYTISDRRGKA